MITPLVTRGCPSLDSCLFVLSGACRAVCRLRAPGRISAAVPCVFVTTSRAVNNMHMHMHMHIHVVRACMYHGIVLI